MKCLVLLCVLAMVLAVTGVRPAFRRFLAHQRAAESSIDHDPEILAGALELVAKAMYKVGLVPEDATGEQIVAALPSLNLGSLPMLEEILSEDPTNDNDLQTDIEMLSDVDEHTLSMEMNKVWEALSKLGKLRQMAERLSGKTLTHPRAAESSIDHDPEILAGALELVAKAMYKVGLVSEDATGKQIVAALPSLNLGSLPMLEEILSEDPTNDNDLQTDIEMLSDADEHTLSMEMNKVWKTLNKLGRRRHE